jgi:hypothetical protein
VTTHKPPPCNSVDLGTVLHFMRAALRERSVLSILVFEPLAVKTLSPYTATGTQERSQLNQIAPSSVLRHLVRVYEGSGISKPAEPLAEIHKATKSPGLNSWTS